MEARPLQIPLPTRQELAELSIKSFGYCLPPHQLPVYHEFICEWLRGLDQLEDVEYVEGLDALAQVQKPWKLQEGSSSSSQPPLGGSVDEVITEKEEKPSQQENASPLGIADDVKEREEEARPFTLAPASGPENPLGAWALRCHIQRPIPHSPAIMPLQGRHVAIKDNIPVRGMPMSCGTSFSFIPHQDSPLVARCLNAGAIIAGKAQCDYMCFSAAAFTASRGLVRNPLATDYHAGGSSSGSAALVAAGEVELSIGSDQGGSVRIPGAVNGAVACKPTYGLVPYTLSDGFFPPIDHAGPITKTVEDNALMLNVLAGWDGVDERASSFVKEMKKVDYCALLNQGVKGTHIGLVKEGFLCPTLEDDVAQACRDATKHLEDLGATIETVSIPLHLKGAVIWTWYVLATLVDGLFHSNQSSLIGVDEQGKICDRVTFLRQQLLANVASWSVTFRMAVLTGEWIRLHCAEAAKTGEAHKQKLMESYEAALSQYDLLMMPTVPLKAKKLPKHLSTERDYEEASAELIAEHAGYGFGYTSNTQCMNLTGHPAVSLPVAMGRVPTDKDQTVVLPISLMLVGKWFDEANLYRVAHSLEQSRPWSSVIYDGDKRLS